MSGNNFHLCKEGEALYLAWSALLDQVRPKVPARKVAAAKRKYIKHRETCGTCTPPGGTHEDKAG